MSAPPRGRGTPRPLYVAPPQRTGSASTHASLVPPAASVIHSHSSQESMPRASRGAPASTSSRDPSHTLHGEVSNFPLHHEIASVKASQIAPVASAPRASSSAHAAPFKHNSSATSSPSKPSSIIRTGKGRGSKQQFTDVMTESIGLTEIQSIHLIDIVML